MSIADKILLRKRALIETVNDELKNIAQIEHSRHRSFSNFIANSLSAIAAYCFFEKKPAIDVKFVNDGQLAIFWFYFELTLDYILKPIDETRLLDAIIKYETLQNKGISRPQEYLDTLLDTLQHKERRYRTRFLIYGADRFWSLQVTDIAYFYSENKITFAVTQKGQEHIIDLSLNKLMEQLDPEQFFRANRQIIISIASIDHAEPYFNGKIVVSVLPPYKAQITISEEKLSSFKLWLNY